jgi:hypothetical protein
MGTYTVWSYSGYWLELTSLRPNNYMCRFFAIWLRVLRFAFKGALQRYTTCKVNFVKFDSLQDD